MNYIRLPLKNAYNVRELGGYPCRGGKITKWHSFIRSDDLYNLYKTDIDFLLSYGLVAVIDLRGEEELAAYPDPFSKIKKVKYINKQLLTLETDDIADATSILPDDPENFLPNYYLEKIKKAKRAIKEIFDFIANQPDGCILFHCKAGKDRTGILAMLLLGLAGVAGTDIIANYEVTYTYFKNSPMGKLMLGSYPPDALFSKAEYISFVLDYIHDHYGNVENYLLSTGLTNDTLGKVKKRLY